MKKEENILNVNLWNENIGKIIEDKNGLHFKYNQKLSFEPSPISMEFSTNKEKTFNKYDFLGLNGIPSICYDSLPNGFGETQLRNHFKAKQKEERISKKISYLEKFAYIGKNGIGAIEFEPETLIKHLENQTKLIELTQLNNEYKNYLELTNKEDKFNDFLDNLIFSTRSPDGVRPKIFCNFNFKNDLININNIENNKLHNKIVVSKEQFESNDFLKPAILKFGENNSKNINNEYLKYATRLEKLYFELAKLCGIQTSNSKLLKTNDDNYHLVIERFDRTLIQNNSNENISLKIEKEHFQSLAAISKSSYLEEKSLPYEQFVKYFDNLTNYNNSKELEELITRIVFNIVGRNCDDHLKNHAFLMNQHTKQWKLSTVFDILYPISARYKTPYIF
jgi:serine/threonine-protein kinase HipA